MSNARQDSMMANGYRISLQGKGARTPFEPSEIERTIPERFAAMVAQYGDRLAVCADSDRWTYEQLNQASNLIGQAILEQGMAGKPCVAVLCGHSTAAIRSLVGVLKAGRTAVMVDLDLPAARIRSILEDAEVGVIVTESAHFARVQSLTSDLGLAVVNVDALEWLASGADLCPAVAAADMVLLLYTSGTTGRPKAVVHSHRSILHRIWVENVEYGVSSEDRFGGLTVASYGASLSEVFGSLLNGASLHMYNLKREGLGRLPAWLAQDQITILRLALTAFRSLAPLLPERAAFPHLRLIRTGGDVIYREDIDLYQRHFASPCALSISLACTEANTICARYIDHQTRVDEPVVAVGWPIDGKEVLLLDEHGRAAGPDDAGEITVRSRYLASGYWRRDDLTNARFIPDPTDEGLVTYLTGDMGRRRPDGSLQHLGRKDSMVKIRGHRVELAEVEGFLQRIDGIRQAAVKAFPTASGDQRLVAYVTPVPDVRLAVIRMREEMGRLAPVYMMPARFVILQALPLTATGKVDRHALPPPGATRPALDTPFVAPRNETEQQLVGLWAELLELDEVGVDDNFFDLGGDSLIALRMVLTVEERYARQIGAAFFTQPTLAHLARLVAGMADEATEESRATRLAEDAVAGKRPERSVADPLQRLARHGPLWRGRALPYGLGVRLQRAWLATPGVPERLFSREIQTLRCWGELLGEPHPAAAIRRSLMANTWARWREQALRVPLGASPWVTIRDDATLLAPASDRSGLILVFLHSALKHLFHASLESAGREFVSIFGGKTARRSLQVHQGYRTLQQGGIVITAGDGRYGSSGVTLPFFGGQFLFRPGPAELAVQTGARLAAVFAFMAVDGHITFEVCPLAAASSDPPGAQVDALTRAYGELMVARWPQVYISQNWDHLRGLLKRATSQPEVLDGKQ